MDGELLLLIVLILIAFGIGITGGKRSGVNVKSKPASKRNKQGRTKDEQELHEWMEDNPR